MSIVILALAMLLPLVAAPLIMLTQVVATGRGQVITVVWTGMLMALVLLALALGLATLVVEPWAASLY